MSFINRCTEKIAKQACLSVVDRELMNYGFKVIYINVSKTLLLFICVMMLNILKEAAILFCAFVCVRLSGFGVHSESTIKCTFIGLTSFIGGTYLAISIEPLSIVVSVLLCCVCITIFVIYAPIETDKHPISEQRKSLFKKAIIITTIALFIFSLCMGETVYRNLIIIGVMLEAYIMLPPIKKIIK